MATRWARPASKATSFATLDVRTRAANATVAGIETWRAGPPEDILWRGRDARALGAPKTIPSLRVRGGRRHANVERRAIPRRNLRLLVAALLANPLA